MNGRKWIEFLISLYKLDVSNMDTWTNIERIFDSYIIDNMMCIALLGDAFIYHPAWQNWVAIIAPIGNITIFSTCIMESKT